MDVQFFFEEMNAKQIELFTWLLEKDIELQNALPIVAAAIATVKVYHGDGKESDSDIREKSQDKPNFVHEKIQNQL